MIRIFMAVAFTTSFDCKRIINFEQSITFTVFNNSTNKREISTFDKDLSTNECDANGNFAVVVHGWKESISTPWVMETINNLRYYRGGCVIFMDYSNFSTVGDYFNLTPHFDAIATVLLRKIKQIRNYDRLFLYGFSFGSRLCFEAGAQLGHQLIDRIDACDPAGPGFDMYRSTVDPKIAAKNVVCINTSTDKGTSKYNCHQNFRMGKCGKSQPAAGRRPFGDHGLCPYFYNSAFKHNFNATKLHDCKSKREAANIPKGFTMGYSRQSSSVQGEFFVPTAEKFPWNVIRSP